MDLQPRRKMYREFKEGKSGTQRGFGKVRQVNRGEKVKDPGGADEGGTGG